MIIQLAIGYRNKKKANQMLERVFSIIAHDLRSPVSSLSNLTELLNHPETKITAQERKTLINQTETMVKSLVGLVDNLLDWSRNQQGLIAYNPEPLKITEVLSENLNMIELMAKNKNIEICRYLPIRMLFCCCSETC